MTNADIKRLIKLVKEEAEKEEDFVHERIRELPMYKKLAAEYSNIDDVVKKALEYAGPYEKMRRYLEKNEHSQRHMVKRDKEAYKDAAVWIAQTFRTPLYDKFVFRYSKDELKKLAGEVYEKTRNESGEYVGKDSRRRRG